MTPPIVGTDLVDLLQRLPPEVEEAERCLLGSLICAGVPGADIDLIGRCVEILHGPADFATPSHGQVYQAITDLYTEHQAVDTVLLTERLRDSGLVAIFGDDYIVGLVEQVGIPTHAEHYAHLVRGAAKRRAVVSLAVRMLHDAHEGQQTADELVESAAGGILALAAGTQRHRAVSAAEAGEDFARAVAERRESQAHYGGIVTGFPAFDDLIDGLQPGSFTIIAARPSVGKTAFALNIAQHVSRGGHGTLVITLEQKARVITGRLVSSVTGIPAVDTRRGRLNDHQYGQVQQAIAHVQQLPLWIVEAPGLAPARLFALVRRYQHLHNLSLVVVDHLHLMNAPGYEHNDTAKWTAISNAIKTLAMELDLPVIALAQLNRESERRQNHRPILADLRGSGALEQDADVIGFLHRESYYLQNDPNYEPAPGQPDAAELLVKKNREGDTDTIPLWWHANTMTFVEKDSAAAQAAVIASIGEHP